eukprot:5425455-Amphidinium_carterae.1
MRRGVLKAVVTFTSLVLQASQLISSVYFHEMPGSTKDQLKGTWERWIKVGADLNQRSYHRHHPPHKAPKP